MKVARVIVDVPASMVNQTFDYRIPEKFQSVAQVGMRVLIPFGPRRITGFIMEIIDGSSYQELKDILDLLDLRPVLTRELIDLGKWLAEETLSLYITTYQAMLPQLLKARYRKEVLKLPGTSLDPDLQAIFGDRDRYAYEALLEKLPSVELLKDALDAKQVKIEYLVESRATKRYERIVTPAKKEKLKEAVEELLPQARRQRDILFFFMENHQPIEQSKLYQKLSINRSHLNPLIQKGLIHLSKREVYRDPYDRPFEPTKALQLTDEQALAYEQIVHSIEAEEDRVFLLHGVTGSGKTEVYLQTIERVLDKGKEAIVLVPEISLTPQMVQRFKGRFGDLVAVLHSGLSMGEKYDEWRKIQRKEVQVVVGARSAIFAPFENLGMIIIDEEHETSYKQEEAPRYHAKEVAIKRAELNGCPVVLGSATPTLESYARAQRGRYQLLPLKKRTNQKPMPPVEIVDMREELHAGNRSMFSRLLLAKIEERMASGEQIVLLLNRRGYSNFILCRDCGFVDQCPQCDISLTYHKREHRLKCHYCLYEKPMPQRCPACQSDTIRFFGTGTERVEEALYKAIPGVKIIRMDVDTTRRKGSHERLLQRFENKEAHLLLGTQMIAKGLDFTHVTLVGVLAADSMLHLPDFRSSERTFQLLTQVSGRAGRHNLAGEVIIQTYTPEHYSVQLASRYDYEEFYLQEMKIRRSFRYPPYYYLSLINFSHEDQGQVYEAAHRSNRIIRNYLSDQAIVLGPIASPIARLKNRYRYQILIKYRFEDQLHIGLEEMLAALSKERRRGLQVVVDMNPYQFM